MDDDRRRLQRAYDRDAERRDRATPEPWRLAIVDRLATHVRRRGGRRVLDLGCGTGQLARRLADHDLEVVAVDLSPAMVARARARGVTAIVADLDTLPFAAASFDGALAFNALLHTRRERLPAVYAAIRRVLAPRAVLTVVTWGGVTRQEPWAGDWLHPPRFFATMSDTDLRVQPIPGFTRIETTVLHDHARDDLHPQVQVLQAR